MRHSLAAHLARGAALLATAFLAGCEHGTSLTSLSGARVTQFSSPITFPQLQSSLTTGPARVEVQVFADSLVARRFELENGEEMTKPEEIRSRITGLAVGSNGTDTLTLALGGIAVTFDASTRVRTVDQDENEDSDMPVADFITRVQAALAAGHHPGVRARRPAPATAQGPTDVTFLAGELTLDEAAALPTLKMNVDQPNLVTNASPPPDGWLEVLGVKIGLDASTEVTELREEDHELPEMREFEGAVQSVDLTAGTATLKNGTVIAIVAGTMFGSESDDANLLTSLSAVQAALAAGDTVRAEGEGIQVSANPDTISAAHVEFQIKSGQEEEQPSNIAEFEDTVATVDVGHSSFTLGAGTVVNVVAGTMIMGETGLTTLQGVADSLAAHVRVRAEGRGTVASAGPPPVLTAIAVDFEAEH